MVRGDCRLRANQPASRPSIMRFLSSFDRAAGTVERWPDGEKPSVSKPTKSTHRRQHGPPGPAHRPRVQILRSPRLLSIHEVLATLVLFWWRRLLRNSVNTREKRVVICLEKAQIRPPLRPHICVACQYQPLLLAYVEISRKPLEQLSMQQALRDVPTRLHSHDDGGGYCIDSSSYPQYTGLTEGFSANLGPKRHTLTHTHTCTPAHPPRVSSKLY